jgi:hypothetical protein
MRTAPVSSNCRRISLKELQIYFIWSNGIFARGMSLDVKEAHEYCSENTSVPC